MFEISTNLFNGLIPFFLLPVGLIGLAFTLHAITLFWGDGIVKSLLAFIGAIISTLLLLAVPLNSMLGTTETVDNPTKFEEIGWETYIETDKEKLVDTVANEINADSISFDDVGSDEFNYRLADGEPVDFTSVNDDGVAKGVLYFTDDAMKIVVFNNADNQQTFTVLTE